MWRAGCRAPIRLSRGFSEKLLSSDPAGSTFLHDEGGIPVFTLNNVFLCLNPLRVKFFQISGSTLQLQQDRNRFTGVGRGANAGSVWTPPASRISTPWTEKPQLPCRHNAWEGRVVGTAAARSASDFCISHPREQKSVVSFEWHPGMRTREF